MNQPLFSILVANYNNGKFFQDCYNSIVSQTYKNFEVIIVDDCSTDNSQQTIQNIIGDDARFTLVVNSQNMGVGFTKKKCADLANGVLCGYLDSDDALKDNALERCWQKHTKNPEASLVYTDSFWCDKNLNNGEIHHYSQVENDNPYFFNNAEIFHFGSYKNEYYKRTSGIDETLMRAVDQDLYLKLYEVGTVKHLNEPLYLYRIHEGGISTTKNVKKAYYWHWVVIIEAGKRRGLNLENHFWEDFILKKDFKTFLNRKWIRLGKKLGLI